MTEDIEKSKSSVAYLIDVSGQIYPLALDSVGIGRAKDNEIVLLSSMVSRYHAEVSYADGFFWLRDLNSKNGTWVNRQMVTEPVRLTEKDTINIGNFQLTFWVNLDNAETISNYGQAASADKPETPFLDIDTAAMLVRINGVVLEPPLSPLEWRLLAFLYENKGQVCTRDQIIENVYQTDDPSNIPFDSAIETLVSRLRKRLQLTDPSQLPRLRTVRGVGYKLEF